MNDARGFLSNLFIRILDHVFDDRFSKFLNPTPEYKAIKKTVAKFSRHKRRLRGALDKLFMDPSATRAFGQLFDGYADEGHMALLERTLCEFLSPSRITTAQARECIAYYAQCLRREYGRDNVIGLLQYASRSAPLTSRLSLDDTTAVRQISRATPPLLLGRPQDPPKLSDDDSVWDRRIDQAKELLKLGEASRAQGRFLAILDDVLERSVESTRIRYRLHTNLAICSIVSEALDDAERWVRKALRDQPLDDLAEALLARVLLARGETDSARRRANSILERNATQPQAWVVIILSSSEPLAPTSLPAELRKDTNVLLALSEQHSNLGDIAQALTIARDASQRAAGSAQSCVSVAESLLYLGTLPGDAIPVPQDHALIANLLDTAIRLIGEVERSSLLSRAYCARSALRLVAGDVDGAERDGQRAYRADSTRNEAAYAWARALAEASDVTRALFVLEQCDSCDKDPRMLALRARLLADIGGRDSELEESVRSAIDLVADDDDDRRVLLDLADLATMTGMIDLAEEALGRLHKCVPKHMASLFLARIDRTKERPQEALRKYAEALSEAPAARRDPIAYEYASAAHSLDSYSEAVSILEDVGVDQAPDGIRRVYVHSLIASKRWDKVSAFVQRMASSDEPLAEWALDVASVVALRSDDLDGAVLHLTQLLSLATEDTAELEARLAQTLFRMGRTEEAVSFAQRACTHGDATGTLRLEMAKLLFQARHYDEAIRTAFLALRELPSSADVDAVYVHIFATSPEEVPSKAEVPNVDVDTWVSLRADDDSEADYWIFGDDITTAAHNELFAASAQSEWLRGRRVGERVTQPTGLDPMTFEVVEVLPIWAQAFREALRRATTRVSSEESPIQSIRVGDPLSVKSMSTITGMLHRSQEAQTKVEQLYSEGRVPLAVLGHLARRTCREAYYRALRLECGVLVDSGTAESLRDSMTTAAAAQRIVIHTSALVTLQELEMLHVLPTIVAEPLIPSSVAIELRTEKTKIGHDLARGDAAWMGLEDDNIVVSHGSPEVARRVEDALDELLAWIESSAVERPRPPEALKAGSDELRGLLGPPSYDSYMLSGPDLPLYADDWVLRQLARAERHAGSFTTYALLCLAMERGVITPPEFYRGVERLIELRHQFVPISADLLLHASRLDAYQLGDRTKRCLRRLVSGSVNSSAPIFASFVRALAVSDLGRSSVALVVKYCVSVLQDLYSAEPHALLTYRAWARNALRLDPLLLKEVERAFTPGH